MIEILTELWQFNDIKKEKEIEHFYKTQNNNNENGGDKKQKLENDATLTIVGQWFETTWKMSTVYGCLFVH